MEKFYLIKVDTQSREAVTAALDQRFKDLHVLSSDNRRAVIEHAKVLVIAQTDGDSTSDASKKRKKNEQVDLPAGKKPSLLSRFVRKTVSGESQDSTAALLAPRPEQRSVEKKLEHNLYIPCCKVDGYPLKWLKKRVAILPAVASIAKHLPCIPASSESEIFWLQAY